MTNRRRFKRQMRDHVDWWTVACDGSCWHCRVDPRWKR